MTATLVTASDGSLGAALAKKQQTVGITQQQMREGKARIEYEIDAILRTADITQVINNFGINHLSWIGATELNDQQILLHNVMAPYWVINHLVRHRQVCRVVNIASATYRVPQRCTAIYCASKAALVQLTKVMARELAPKGWVINALAPGLIKDTRMARVTNAQVLELRGWDSEQADQYAKKLIPMGRYTTTAEVAEAVFKLLALPDYINGAVIDMTGGV